jgi:hypothetical protein
MFAPCSAVTPSITSCDVPMPSIFAPIAMRHSARSSISGSRAALPARSRLRRAQPPSARFRWRRPRRTGNSMRAPLSRPGAARRHSPRRGRSRRPAPPAPSGAGRPAARRWRSRRAARPWRRRCARPAGPAPGTRRASCARCRRMRRAISVSPSPRPAPSVNRPSTPKLRSSSAMARTSARRGTLVRTSGSAVSKARRHQRQGGVLGAADGISPCEPRPALRMRIRSIGPVMGEGPKASWQEAFPGDQPAADLGGAPGARPGRGGIGPGLDGLFPGFSGADLPVFWAVAWPVLEVGAEGGGPRARFLRMVSGWFGAQF